MSTSTVSTTAGAGGGLGIGVLVVYLAQHFGVSDLTPEVGVVLGGLATASGSAIGRYGLVGCWRRLWYGPEARRAKRAVGLRPPDTRRSRSTRPEERDEESFRSP